MNKQILILLLLSFSALKAEKIRLPIWSAQDDSTTIICLSISSINSTVKDVSTYGINIEYLGEFRKVLNILHESKYSSDDFDNEYEYDSLDEAPLHPGSPPQFISKSTLFNINGINFSFIGAVNGKNRVNGINLNILGSSYYIVNGLNLSIVANHVQKFNGLEFSLFHSKSILLNGIQISCYNTILNNINGIQIGLYNYSYSTNGLQLGLLNISEGWNKIQGIQLGLINNCFIVVGFQFGAYNNTRKIFGSQFGIINKSMWEFYG